MTPRDLWQRYRDHLCVCESIGLRLDISRMDIPDDFFERHAAAMERAYAAMAELEDGAVANPDEDRQVGHYWLRAPELAPTAEQRRAIESAIDDVALFARRVHESEIRPIRGERFTDFLLVGIGGSALGPQLVADALGGPGIDRLRPWFFDNTDPDGMNKVLAALGDRMAVTLVLVVSKSGGTPETRNGLRVVQAAFEARGLPFASHAVAITGEGSKLDAEARESGWLATFPMWDWVGGRTSETSAVGLLPAALQGIDIDAILAGAREADALTRVADTPKNPAALLALVWLHATRGRGEKDMVILPYRDRLLLFSRYLQQLVMESLGKGEDLDGNAVTQGIAVYGNKGSTDQHAYVQQLREGVPNFFVTFVEVRESFPAASAEPGAEETSTAETSIAEASAVEVEPGVYADDYLRGFLLGTREALWHAGRTSITVSLDRLDPHRLGALIALYERAVGFYATLVNVNAYHQPGVEAGKKAAGEILALQKRALEALGVSPVGEAGGATVGQLAGRLGAEDRAETLFQILEGLASSGRLERSAGSDIFEARYALTRNPGEERP